MGTYHTGVYVRYIPDTKRIVQHMYVLPWYIQARRLLLFQIRNVLSNMCTYNLGTCYEAYQGKGHTSGIYQLVPGLRETSSLVTTFRNPHPKHRQPPPAQRQKKLLIGLTGNNYRSSVAAVTRIHIRPLAVASMEHVHLQMEG